MVPSISTKTELAEKTAINVDGEKLQKGLAKLVLTLIDILRQILERQAQRRIALGTLSEEEIERLGVSFMQVKQKVIEIAQRFDLKPGELNLNLDSLLQSGDKTLTHATLVDVVDKLLDKGTVVAGEVVISVADVDLVVLDLLAMLSSVHALEKQDLTSRKEVKTHG